MAVQHDHMINLLVFTTCIVLTLLFISSSVAAARPISTAPDDHQLDYLDDKRGLRFRSGPPGPGRRPGKRWGGLVPVIGVGAYCLIPGNCWPSSSSDDPPPESPIPIPSPPPPPPVLSPPPPPPNFILPPPMVPTNINPPSPISFLPSPLVPIFSSPPILGPGQQFPSPGQKLPPQQFPPQVNPGQQFPPQVNPGQQFPPQVNPGQQFPPQVNPGQQFLPQVNPGQQFPPQLPLTFTPPMP